MDRHPKKNLKRIRIPSSSDSFSVEDDLHPPRRRRRFISSDSLGSEPVNENNEVATIDPELVVENITHNISTNASAVEPEPDDTDDVLSFLGEDTTLNKQYDEDIHAHIAVRWNNILQKGLKKEQQSNLLKKYLTPENCSFLEAPKLNEQIKVAVHDSAVKRDATLQANQTRLGSSLACIGRALDVAFKIPDKELREQLIKHLGNGGQILCDLHYTQTLTRRSLLVQGLDKNTKEAVKNLTRDKLLFGGGLADTLKAVKGCSKSAGDLKMKSFKPPAHSVAGTSGQRSTTDPSLNWRGPSRRLAYSATTAGGYQHYRERRQPATAWRPPPSRGPRAPPPPAKRF